MVKLSFQLETMLAAVNKIVLHRHLALFVLTIQASASGQSRGSFLGYYIAPRPGWGFHGRTILSPFNRNSAKLNPSIQQQFQKFEFYLKFLASFSNFKRWESLALLFARHDPFLCRESRVFLLKEAEVTAKCVRKENNGEIKTIGSNFRGPLVFFNFVSGGKFREEHISKLNFTPGTDLDMLVISESFNESESIIKSFHTEIMHKHYKLAVAYRLNTTHVNLEDVYGFSTSTVPLRNHYGQWSYSGGMSVDTRKFIGPTDFGGRYLRITTLPGPPLVVIKSSDKNLTVNADGYLPRLLGELAAHLKFSYRISSPHDESFGTEVDGNWSGMVGLLQRKEMDIALMSLSYTANRKKVMDFSTSVEYSATQLLIRRDWQNNELKWTAYTDPFQWEVWLAIPLTVVLGVCAFIAFTHYKLMTSTPAESAWLLSLCFLQQGQEEHVSLKTFPCRLTLGCFWILAVIVYASYTARLTSYLAATTNKLPVNSLSEAVSNRHWKISVVKGASVPDRVRDSNCTTMKKLWQRIQEDPSTYVPGIERGIERVYQERLLFFTSDLVPTYLTKGNCSFAWIPGEKYFPGFGYMGYQKHLPFGPRISQYLARMRETGIANRLFTISSGAKTSCTEKSDNQGGFVGMSLYETGTAFLILICGIILSFISVFLEIFVYLYKPFQTLRLHRDARARPSIFSGSSIATSTNSLLVDFTQPGLLR